MKAHQVWFTEPLKVEVRQQQLPAPGPGQVLVKNLYSGISAGTEMLVYRGQLPESMALDASLAAFAEHGTSYPLQYGYACVGRIEQVGAEVDSARIGEAVFAFQPHASHYLSDAAAVIPLPQGVDPRSAVFLANMETAVNLVLDGAPRLGERALVIGQGVVGLLTTRLLAAFPLSGLYVADALAHRRNLAEQAGAHGSYDPGSAEDVAALDRKLAPQQERGGADLVFELSGAPTALNLALELCGYGGRIVVGSWYGNKGASLNLGESFHRNRISLVSSQVSTIGPELSGRWDKTRRFALAWEMIRQCQPEQFITHSMPIDAAPEAYALLHESPGDAVQVIFDYQD